MCVRYVVVAASIRIQRTHARILTASYKYFAVNKQLRNYVFIMNSFALVSCVCVHLFQNMCAMTFGDRFSTVITGNVNKKALLPSYYLPLLVRVCMRLIFIVCLFSCAPLFSNEFHQNIVQFSCRCRVCHAKCSVVMSCICV